MGISICVIGCGGIALGSHGPAYLKYKNENPECKLAACCDLSIAKADEFKEKFGFERSYDDYIKMLGAEKPSAVCITVNEKFVADIAAKVMEMGYPVIMEKPPGRNISELNKIIDAAKMKNVPNQVAFNRRFTPIVMELKSRLDEKFKPCDIQNIRCDFFRVNRKDFDFSTTAIHGIDAVRFLAGSDFSYIRFHYQEFSELGENVSNIYLDCEFKSGATAQLNFCPVTGTALEKITVNTFNNTYILDMPIWSAIEPMGRLVHFNKGSVAEDLAGSDIAGVNEMFEASGFYQENKSFFDDISAGKYPENNVNTTMQSVIIADCIRNRLNEYKFV